nr:MAK10-like protein [Tanacetum cinerariifolium]
MGDENPIRTLGDYYKPSHESYRNTIELPIGNNMVPLRSDTISLVQNGCSFYELRSEDPNQHLKDFLKLVDSLDLDGENRERTRMPLFQVFPSRTIDQSASGKLRDRNAEESWALLEDLTFYDNESWNDPRDFAKPIKAITLPQDLSARSHPTIDHQCSSQPSTSINAIKAYSKEANIFETNLPQTGMGIETQQPKDPEPTLENEFQDLHLNLSVLEVLAQALIYNVILDKYVKSLDLGKNGSAFVQGEIPVKMEEPRLFTLPCKLGD